MTDAEMAALCDVLALDAEAASHQWAALEVHGDGYERAFVCEVYAGSQTRLADYRRLMRT